MAEVRISKLTKRYSTGQTALEEVDLTAKDGEFIVLLGPSGCGKSTLLRLVAGLEQRTSGSIEIGEQKVDLLSPSERSIGMVFQDYALYPHMTVSENLAFGLKMRGVKRADRESRIQEIARILQIEEFLKRKPAQLSGGQRQRVAIGRALVKNPKVLLFDEPLSNLDSHLRLQTRAEIAAIHQRIGSTTLYVTHDQEEAMALANRILVLNRGKIQQIGTPREIYEKPANRFVASFVGSPPINILEGSLRKSGEQMVFETQGQRVTLRPGSCPAQEGQYSLCFRPESTSLDERGLQVQIQRTEFLGAEGHLLTRLGEKTVVLMITDQTELNLLSRKKGEYIRIGIHSGQFHWFDEKGNRAEVEYRRLAG